MFDPLNLFSGAMDPFNMMTMLPAMRGEWVAFTYTIVHATIFIVHATIFRMRGA